MCVVIFITRNLHMILKHCITCDCHPLHHQIKKKIQNLFMVESRLHLVYSFSHFRHLQFVHLRYSCYFKRKWFSKATWIQNIYQTCNLIAIKIKNTSPLNAYLIVVKFSLFSCYPVKNSTSNQVYAHHFWLQHESEEAKIKRYTLK